MEISCTKCGSKIGHREITSQMDGDYGLAGALLVVNHGQLVSATCKSCRVTERAAARAPIGWRILRGDVVPVSQQDLDRATRKPRVYKTQESATNARDAMQRRREADCVHDWEFVSHEESRCRKCGRVECFMDDVSD